MKKAKTTLQKSAGAATFLLFLMAFAAACNNSRFKVPVKNSLNENADAKAPTGDLYKISTVTITLPGNTTGSTPPSASIFFDTAKSPVPISNHCNVGKTGSGVTTKPCACLYTWSEVNQSTGNNVSVPRVVQTDVTNVQPSMVTCSAPQVYTKEITDGTMIKVSVIPAAGSSEIFTVTPYNYTKNMSTKPGAYQDSQGYFFDNVLHYSCYEQSKRGMSVVNKISQQNDPNTGDLITFPIASQFCVAKANATGTPATGCETLAPPDNTAQAYYYNLFIRSSERGDINQANDRYVCPQVKESLQNGGTVGGQGQFWPLDSTFSLAIGPTPDFNVGVEAFTKVSKGNDPVSANSKGCYVSTENGGNGGTGSPANFTSLVKSCLGFASKPNSDGTCPYFKDSNGNIRPTFRLRRFIALYPPVFDTDGKPINQAQATDTIYVLDRPVYSPAADPLKPFSMRGPKPCPFAFFDNKGVLGLTDPLYPNGLPVYGATNNPGWNGTNVDGIQFPNTDRVNSCSAAIPLLNFDRSVFSIGTLNALNPVLKKLYVRPIRAWAPHYEEDTDFLACAPQAAPMKDPPLHFSKDLTTGNVSWCAESYPSQNDSVPYLDQRTDLNTAFPGKVAPFTSHVVKNSASASCIFTPLSSIPTGNVPGTATPIYPSANGGAACSATGNPNAFARHPADLFMDTDTDLNAPVCSNRTCDRTVVTPGLIWPRFPLLATAPQVEAAISADTTYGCIMTYDAGGKKTGTTSPKEGCCGPNVHVWTGTAGYPNNRNAHLEPDIGCLVPAY